jgi:hypothetical protein
LAKSVDFPSITLSGLAKVLAPTLQHANRVYRERQAARGPTLQTSNLLDESFEETLGRLIKGEVEESWWRHLLNAIEQQFVAPDFLQNPGLQDWLSYESIQEDFKAEARRQILGTERIDAIRHLRLRSRYSEITGERAELASGPIDAVVSILIAGYVASLSSQVKPVVAMIQASHADTIENLARIEKKIDLNRLEDPTVTKTHTNLTEARLSSILKCRTFSTEKSRENICALLREITEGDLRHVEKRVRAQTIYWAARLCATKRETLSTAEELVRQLQDELPDFDRRIPEALIQEIRGDVNGALNLLAQIDNADGRATFFNVLVRTRGVATALEWFDGHEEKKDP